MNQKMYKVTYSLGRVNRYVNLKFSVTLRSSKGVDSVKRSNMYGNQYLFITGLYPTLTIELSDELKDENTRIWSTGRLVNLSKLTAITFVKSGRLLLEKFKSLKNLFGYQDGVLLANKDLAWENREVIQAEYGKAIMLLPSVVEDQDSHVQYEGITFMINELSNYAKITYQEFESMVDYIDKLDFDSLGIQLLNTALLMRSNKPIAETATIEKQEEVTELPAEIDSQISEKEVKEQSDLDNVQWRAIHDTNQIPEI